MLKRIGAAGTRVTAVVALIAGTLSLLFQLVPQLKPDPRENVGADVSIYRIEPSMTLGDWVDRAFTGSERKKQRHQLFEVDKNDPTFAGAAVYVRTTVDGYKHRKVFLAASIYDADTQQPYDFLNPFGGKGLPVDAPSRRSVQLLWVPDLKEQGPRTFVQVELSDENGMLAVDDTPTLTKPWLAPSD